MLAKQLIKTEDYKKILNSAKAQTGFTALFGLPTAARAQIMNALYADTKKTILVITANEAQATRFVEDSTTFGLTADVYPARDFMMRNIEGQSREYEHRRLNILGQLINKKLQLVAAPIEAVLQCSLPKDTFVKNTLQLKKDEEIARKSLLNHLDTAGYQRRETVDGTGQFSVRGDIVDIFSPDMKKPIRIEFWGDTIESIHTFNLVSQRREENLKYIYISPAREVLFGNAKQTLHFLEQTAEEQSTAKKQKLLKVMQPDLALLDGGIMPEGLDKYIGLLYPSHPTLLDYFDDSIILMDDPTNIYEESKTITYRTQEEQTALLEEGVLSAGMDGFYKDMPAFMHQLQNYPTIFAEVFARTLPDVKLKEIISIPAHSLPPWSGSVESLTEEVRPLLHNGFFVGVLAGTPRAATALAKDLQADGLNASYSQDKDPTPVAGHIIVTTGHLSTGIEYPTAKLAIFTSRQHNIKAKKKNKAKNKGLSSLTEIKPGDHVVHQNHGIGIYQGIQRIDLQGVVKDYLKISYAKADTLYVPVTQLDLLSRYTAPGDEERVKLAKLGGTEWGKTKSRVRKATQEMAKELIELYARRGQAPGIAFPKDNEWQRDFETRFEYDETDDQLACIQEIKKDMQTNHPMDRLLCGDVGVGKTEVALRAAFKAVMGGKQCAFLVPTTILAWQHYNTILSRMEAFPIKVELLNRFRTPKQQKEVIKGLNNGQVDIVVGTHRILQKDVKFKDLGLVIVDEEQRFGVKAKEKLKENFIRTDMLTLSATPIPRTLNMALSGIRDMSVIEEPPQERQPIETYVLEYEEGIIASAINKELARGGQVYYLHNRVDSIENAAIHISKMVPEATIGIAHGKMNEEELSKVWQRLQDGKIDVLVCTTLIETGIDIRNCNTLIIEDADRMGLAQLYQIRGRVGRSGRKAYAYLTFRRDKVLTDIAAKRLSAIKEFTSFGSGFRIAMRDLQIRGVGNLLGESQHGHMSSVGYDLYVKMLNQAISSEKGEEIMPDKSETLIDITIDAFIPENYIPSLPGRIEAYRKIASIENQDDADTVLEELNDRYGQPKNSVKSLIDISLLRVVAAKLGIYEINQTKDMLRIYSDRLDFAALKKPVSSLQRRLIVDQSAKPYLGITIKQTETPLIALNETIEKIQEYKTKKTAR